MWRRSRLGPSRPAVRIYLTALACVALGVGLLLAPVAHADLRPGSQHTILTRAGALREPLPRILGQLKVVRSGHGRIAVKLGVRYRVSNWRGSRRARRDRALVLVTVARRRLHNGPDPSDPVFRDAWTDRRLRHRVERRDYDLKLDRRASRFLIGRGIFSSRRDRRRAALRLISVQVEQERDFKWVDGNYDWREGTAFSPADLIPGPLRPGEARASGSAHPEGTLSVTDATAAGVYCQHGCPQWDGSTGSPGTVAGTENSSFAAPLAVSGVASVCFEQGSHGSNPEGFANFGADGKPQPYWAGTVTGSYDNGIEELPAVSGTTVTEGITAYDGLHSPSEEESAIVAASAVEKTSLGLDAIKVGAGAPASGLSYAISYPSPGAIVSAVLGLSQYLIGRSCDGTPNLLDLSAAETGGGAFSAEIEAQVERFGFYLPGAGGAAGVQLNPSTQTLEGSPVYLMPRLVLGTGLADNICDCRGGTGNNEIYLEWTNYEPCSGYYGTSLDCSTAAPTDSYPVGGGGSQVDCGAGDTACDFPAAAGAATPPTRPSAGIGEVTSCATNFHAGTRLSAGQAVTSPNGTYTLAMLTNGALSWFDGPANSMWVSTQSQGSGAMTHGTGSIRAGSYAIMQGDGNFVVYTPQGEAIFATGTNGHEGAYLSLQSDGNLVVYGPQGEALWASNTYRGPSCYG